MGGVACRRPGYRGGDSAKADPSPPIARRPATDTHLRAFVCVRVFKRVCAMGPPESNTLPLPFLSYTPDLPPPAAPRIASDQRDLQPMVIHPSGIMAFVPKFLFPSPRLFLTWFIYLVGLRRQVFQHVFTN